MSWLNENDLNERRRDHHSNNNNLEMYFEDEKNKTRRKDIYFKCRKCLNRRRNPCFCLPSHQGKEKTCQRFSSSFPFTNWLGILSVLSMFFISLGSAASTINTTITHISTTTTPAAPSRGRWCQKLLNEKKTKEVTETKLCSESYNSSCGFFSFTTCTFTRYKICTRIYNHTFLAYKTVMDCCPGWGKRDNDTCVELDQKPRSLPSIHELSVGTFAAICIMSAFVMIIVFFIVKAVWKKKRKEKAAAESVHMEQIHSLDAPRPQQEVPLIPPQPMMANPHSLVPPESYGHDDQDLVAAAAVAPVAAAAADAFVPTRSYSFGESDALCPRANPDLEDEVTTGIAPTKAAPVEDQVGMKLLQKIPVAEDTGETATPADTTATTTPDSKENLGLSENPELQVELFIREDGDAPDKSEPVSQTQLQTQTLPENSKNDSQDLQVDPKI